MEIRKAFKKRNAGEGSNTSFRNLHGNAPFLKKVIRNLPLPVDGTGGRIVSGDNDVELYLFTSSRSKS